MSALNISGLKDKLNTIESFIPQSETIDTKVSKVNVAWHLDHSLMVINGVIKTMQDSEPTTYKNNFSVLGRIVIAFQYIPKGKGEAPKHVIPPETILIEDIKAKLAEAKENIQSIPTLDDNAFFKHPLFGNINSKRVVRFLETHTNHHLKIVKSILK